MTTTTKNNKTVILVRVRAAVHLKEKADRLRAENKLVDIVDIDYNKPETIVDALNGIDKLFLLTLPRPNMPEITSRVINEAKKNEVKHIVKLSVLSAEYEPGLIIGRMHRQEEKLIEESGIPYTFLRAGPFMQNFINFFGQTIRIQNAIYLPGGEGRVSFVDARDIAAVATKILLANNNGTKINQQYENKKYGITGNEGITYVNISEEDARNAMKKMGMEDWLIDALLEFYGVIRSGDVSQSTTAVEQITGRKPISLEQFVGDYVSSFN